MEYAIILVGIIIIAIIFKKVVSCMFKTVLTLIVIALVAAAYLVLTGKV